MTIAIPVYKRLQYLPNALRSVGAQDYQNVELIVSDNGRNGSQVRDLVAEFYERPYKFRQTPVTVPAPVHYNQLVEAAAGEYFVLLNDDDEISANYVSELVQHLERRPRAAVGLSRQEIIDAEGNTLRYSANSAPEIMSADEFISCVVSEFVRFRMFRHHHGKNE